MIEFLIVFLVVFWLVSVLAVHVTVWVIHLAIIAAVALLVYRFAMNHRKR